MHKIHLLIIIIVTAGSALGCVPACDPVWTSDSQSVIVSKSDGAVIQYDLDKRAQRQLLGPDNYRPSRVAISPDGKQAVIAVAEFGQTSRRVAVQIVRLSDGQSLTVEDQTWGDANAARTWVSASAYWCPSGKRVLICYSDLKNLVTSVVYDPASRKFQELRTTPPPMMFCAALNLSPILPDGSGYIGFSSNKDTIQLRLVKWDGWEYALTQEGFDVPMVPKDLGSKVQQTSKLDPSYLGQARWEGLKLMIPFADRTIVADFPERKLTTRSHTKAEQSAFQLATSGLAAGSISAQSVRFSKGDLSVVCRSETGKGTQRVELVDRSTNGRRLLLTGNPQFGLGARMLTLSPDGEHVLVVTNKDGTNWGYLVKYDGAIVGKIDLGKVR